MPGPSAPGLASGRLRRQLGWYSVRRAGREEREKAVQMRMQKRGWERRLAVGALVMLTLVVGCNRRSKGFVPADQEPPLPERVVVPGLDVPKPPAPSRPSTTTAMPDAPSAPADPAAEIRGSIRLADGVEAGSGVLFVIARSGGAGPPLAVRRLDPSKFPIEFTIGPSDVMIQGRPFAGPITLTARLDGDGNAMTREPTDLSGGVEGPIQPGASNVEIVLKRGGS
jgi:hypothetical protein